MNTARRECFIGLIAPIGVDLDAVVTALEQAFQRVKYSVNQVRLTDIFRENGSWYNIESSSEIDRYNKFIKAGDSLCRDSGLKSILAFYGIASLSRYKDRGNKHETPNEVVHVFRQLKRVEEVTALKEVYGRNILLVGCYTPKSDRISYLVRKMLKNERGHGKNRLESKALEIIATDEEERDDPFGQRVIECYPHADYVMDCSTHDSLMKSAARLVDIYFGNPFISPSRDEYCSYIANAASYRSLDLSRQVGAAIFGDQCELLALGCNEVPQAGGGTYWSGEGRDFRDYAIGYDSNQKVREDMTRDALVRLQAGKWLNENLKDLKPDDLVSKAFSDIPNKQGPLSQSMISDIIEFGRMVHAEMNALTDAARFRRSTIDATMYCTTLSCHMCTKLIIAPGISRVVYIQPYAKSLVEELFVDSVVVDSPGENHRVSYETLKGVTPNGFKMAFHKKGKRKEKDGSVKRWNPIESCPTFLSTFPYYVQLEVRARDELKKGLEAAESARQRRESRRPRAARTKKA